MSPRQCWEGVNRGHFFPDGAYTLYLRKLSTYIYFIYILLLAHLVQRLQLGVQLCVGTGTMM